MAEHPVQGMLGTAIDKIRSMVDSNTIIGDPIHPDDKTTIIPVSRVTFGFAAGGSDVGAKASKDMFGGGSGAGVSVTPIAFLVIADGNVRTIQLLDKATGLDNAIAALPELVDKVSSMLKKDKPAPEGGK